MSTLLDTNVLSELLRSQPAPAVLAWFAEQPSEGLFVSAVTQAEMMLGARLLPAGKRRKTLETALAAMFADDFAGRILPFDSASVDAYVELVSERRAMGSAHLPVRCTDRGHRETGWRPTGHPEHRRLPELQGCVDRPVDQAGLVSRPQPFSSARQPPGARRETCR